MSKRKLYRLLFSLGFLLVSGGILSVSGIGQEQSIIKPSTLGTQSTSAPTTTVMPSITLSATNASVSAQNPPGEQASVNRVVDGDTIDVLINGVKKKIRMIGVNTPESVDPRTKVQCFGREASNYTKQLLSQKTVILEEDPSQDSTDKYGRLLRYVWLDGVNINKHLIANGYAYEYTYEVPYKYQSEFTAAQQEAETSGRGLWAKDTCSGKK